MAEVEGIEPPLRAFGVLHVAMTVTPIIFGVYLKHPKIRTQDVIFYIYGMRRIQKLLQFRSYLHA